MYKNLIIIGIISIFLFGTASSASNSKTINISGTWYFSAIQFTYEIKQVENSFYWDVISPIHEHGVGTINNSSVFAKWKGDNGEGSASGTIVVDDWGNPRYIKWSNGAEFLPLEPGGTGSGSGAGGAI